MIIKAAVKFAAIFKPRHCSLNSVGIVPFLLTFFMTLTVSAQSADQWFRQGLESFRWRKTNEAVQFFRKAAETDPGRDMYFLYLGIASHQAGQLQNAELAYTDGVSLNGAEYDRLLLNRANLRHARGDSVSADGDYEMLISGGGDLASAALLNRANMRLNQASFALALDDFSRYLIMEPDAPQRSLIGQLVGKLEERLAAEAEAARIAEEQARIAEERRLAAEAEAARIAEEQARIAEERRLAEEARRAEEEARQAALMAEVLESLNSSGEETKNITAGTEDIREDFEVSDLED